ncbi:MAG: Lrp/AsnC family transcriptional regulator, partial [Candidatus Helarchaeota archaeon]
LINLAAKLNLTPATVKYRIDRLVETGIIDKFTVTINRKKAGFEVLAYLIIHIRSRIHLGILTSSLKSLQEIAKISVMLGNPDLVAEINVKDMNHLFELVKKINQIEVIQKFEIWIITDIVH